MMQMASGHILARGMPATSRKRQKDLLDEAEAALRSAKNGKKAIGTVNFGVIWEITDVNSIGKAQDVLVKLQQERALLVPAQDADSRRKRQDITRLEARVLLTIASHWCTEMTGMILTGGMDETRISHAMRTQLGCTSAPTFSRFDRCLLAEANVKWAELLEENGELLTVQKLLHQARALPRPSVRNSTKWEGAKKQLENVEIRLQGLPAPGGAHAILPIGYELLPLGNTGLPEQLVLTQHTALATLPPLQVPQVQWAL